MPDQLPNDLSMTKTLDFTARHTLGEEALTVRLYWLVVNSSTSATAKYVGSRIVCDHWSNQTNTKRVKCEVEVVKDHDDVEVCEIIDGKKICRKESHVWVHSWIEEYWDLQPSGTTRTSIDDTPREKPGILRKTLDNNARLMAMKSEEYEGTTEA